MKHVLVLLAVSFIFSHFASGTDIPAGSVSGTWTAANSPYYILGDVQVPNNQVLIIEPGVEVIFKGYYQFSTNYADLIAVGTADSMIRFTMEDADTNGLVNGADNEGGWNGFRFWYSSSSGDTTRLEYCIFEYAKVRDNVAGGRGVVGTERIPRLKVANCIFRYNYSRINGVDCRLADVFIEDNLFHNNVGENLISTSQANPYVHRNEVRDNACIDVFNVYSWCFPEIRGNLIVNNEASNILEATGNKADPMFVNNRILNNEVSGYVLYLNGTEASILDNEFANNTGLFAYINDGANTLMHNTIANNHCLASYILYLNQTGGKISGNIIYGNNGFNYYNKGTEEPAITYNLIQGGVGGFSGDVFTGTETGNLNTNPLFVSPTTSYGTFYDAESADFSLSQNSPCINTGDPSLSNENFLPLDINSRQRVKYSIIDMGAAETFINVLTSVSGTIAADQMLIGDTIQVTGDIVINDNVTLTIAGGAYVMFMGPYEIDVNGTLIAAGTRSDTIVFTVADTTGFSGPDFNTGGWKGIVLNNAGGTMDDNMPSRLEYCVFEYGKNNSSGRGGILSLQYINDFTASHCVFRNNRSEDYYASVLYATSSNFLIEHCLITRNQNLVNAYSSRGSFKISGSHIRLENNVFSYNVASTGACLDITGCELYASNNLYHNNRHVSWAGAGTVLEASNSECYLWNEIIANNSTANYGVLNFSSCEVSIMNCNIVHNQSNNSSFSGGIGLTRTNAQAYNSIFWGNRAGSNRSSFFLLEENTDPDLYYCLLEDGAAGIHTYSGFSFTGAFEEGLDEDPVFISPTTGAGPGYDATGSDWNLYDISPAINRGTPDTSGLMVPGKDFSGAKRISNERIDIGAYEKSGTPAEITAEPQGAYLCTGDPHILAVSLSGSDSVFVVWKKDGVTVPGQEGPVLAIDSTTLADEGNYICYISNAFGTVHSIPVYLSVKAAPKILVEPEVSWVKPDQPLTLSTFVEGSAPISYQWYRNDTPLPAANFPELRMVPTGTEDEGMYYCEISNVCGTDTTTPQHLYIAPQICMVTVDSTSGKNLIVWENATTADLLAFNIYRESSAAGIYDLLATLPADELTQFTDSTADPTVQAYLYQITGVEQDGSETDADLCRIHKTIHLLVSTNPELNTTQLEWDKYSGFDYQTYNILRSDNGGPFLVVDSLASSLNSWTDPSPAPGFQAYRISVRRPEMCIPTAGGKKATTGPYTHALSNLDDNKLLQEVNHPPDTLMLDNHSITEGNAIAALIGRLSVEDPDSNDTHSFALVSGEGDVDNGSFTIVGDLLLAAQTFIYQQDSVYSVRIKAVDLGSNAIEDTFRIIILQQAVGLKDFQEGSVRVYPNPVKESATVLFPNPQEETYRLKIMDLSGRTVLDKGSIRGNRFRIHTSALPKGYYILEISGSRVYRERIVIE